MAKEAQLMIHKLKVKFKKSPNDRRIVSKKTTKHKGENFARVNLRTYAERHCERSEAIQKCQPQKDWIATPPTEARNDEGSA
jgi:hypothetical protein